MKFTVAMIGLALAVSPIGMFQPAFANTETELASPRMLANEIAHVARGAIRDFYEEDGSRPIWIEGRMIGGNAQIFLQYLEDADVDGLKPSRYRPDRLRLAIARADSGNIRDLAEAEAALSNAFARYVRDIRRVDKDIGYEFADPSLKPERPDEERVLRVAATTSSFDDYIHSMGWMSPLYVRTRDLLKRARTQRLDDHVVDTIRLNLERARYLPPPTVRHIVVDAASARLWYYQAGSEAGTMKVVVGAKETQTPMLIGALNYAVVNPYWNVPDYLVRDNVAKKVLGGRTLASMHMEVLSGWDASASKIDPATVDWTGIAAGTAPLPRVRELPGPHNSMGYVKFLFPNDHGIYLHDTPNRALFAKDDRHVSNGCIRLEKAWVLGEWMMGKGLRKQAKQAGPEQPIPMTATVPVYLTYITVVPTKQGIGILPDVYGLDQMKP